MNRWPAFAAGERAPSADRIEYREVTWGGRFGELRHEQMAFQGERLLEGEDLDYALERPDLADSYRLRRNVKVLVALGSIVALVGGIAAASTAIDRSHCGQEDCPGAGGMAILSFVGFTSAALLAVGSVGMSADPLDARERAALIDAHNRGLGSARLGGARIAGFVAGAGGGLVLSGRF